MPISTSLPRRSPTFAPVSDHWESRRASSRMESRCFAAASSSKATRSNIRRARCRSRPATNRAPTAASSSSSSPPAPEPMIYAGVELGGTKCVAILARDPTDVLARETIATTAPDETLAHLERILAEWKRVHGFDALGVASFGPLDLGRASKTYGHILTTPKLGWSHVDVLSRFMALGVPVAFDTDVNGAALAEMRWGSGRGFDDFAYVTVGTGVGVGLIVNGQPTRGFAHCDQGHIRA